MGMLAAFRLAPIVERFPALKPLATLPRPVLIGAGALALAFIVVSLLWLREPTYKVLFSNLDDRDGGAIIAALEQQNIPYRFSENGSAILISEDQIYATRLQLAEAGLPQGSDVGFEILDNTRFGASEFNE